MTQDPVQHSKDDASLEQSLQVGLTRAPLSDAAYARIYAVVEGEWRAVVRSRAARRTWGAIAAGLAAVVLMTVVWRSMPDAPVVGSVARVEVPGTLEAGSSFSLHRSLGVGSVLRQGETLTARGPALLVLQGGGSVRLARGTELSVASADRIDLRAGEIYVDIPPNLSERATFTVSTTVGPIEHLGTQFAVACIDLSIRVRVREGAVRVGRDVDAQTVVAGTELLISKAGVLSRHEISAHGAEWAWTAAVAPEYDIEGRKLADFLQWTSRETGRQLSWGDERARQAAGRVELHGSVRGLPANEALDRVLATTSLRLAPDPDVIRISSGD